MPRLRSIQNSFTSGELDPLVKGRTDIQQYYNGLELARNVFLLPQGGAKRRDGMEYIDTLPEQITRVTGQTITTPRGGTGANANDDDLSTVLTTVTGISTIDPYVVAHYDLLAAKTIKFADVLGFRLDAGTSSGEFRVQYSTDDITFVDFGTSTMVASTTEVSKRHHSTTVVTARYWRFVRIGATDLTTSVATIDEFNVWEESGTLSEAQNVQYEFSTTQTYKLVFSDYNLAIYKGKTLQTHIKAPYTSAQVQAMNWTQSLDTMITVLEDAAPWELQRLGADDLWEYNLATITNAPRYQFTAVLSNPAATLTPSAVTGTVDLTASAAVFSAPNVGQYITGNGGRARILSFTSTTVVKAYILIPFWDTTAIASGDWELEAGYEDAWSAARGWPRSVSFHQGRLWFGGSKELPQTMWASRIALFFDFDLGTNLDDEGIAVTLDTDSVSSINDIFSGRHLQIFTSNAEFYVPSIAAVTPSTVEFRRATNYGSKEGLRVHNVDGATIFVNRSGGAVREFLFIDVEQTYHAQNLSLLASHLVRTPLDSAFRKSTSTEDADYLLLVNNDGTLAIMNTLRLQEITGWSLIETDGDIKSVGVELDTMFFVTERTINGSLVRYVEYFDPDHSTDASTLITTGLPTDTFSGLDHLEGETVSVIADGNRLTDVTVSGGSVTIERDAETSVEFGLTYVQTGDSSGDGYKIKSMPIEGNLPDGTMVGRKARIVEVTVRMTDTKSMKVNDNRVSFRQFGSDLLDADTPNFTGDKVVEGLLDFNDNAQFTVGDDVPLPATINSVAYKVSV